MNLQVSQDALRLRTLATLAPLLGVRAGASAIFGALCHEDLTLHALGALLNTWQLGTGDDLLDKSGLAQKIADRVMEQAAALSTPIDPDEATDYGEKIVDTLLNSKERGAPFRSVIYDRARRVHETYNFQLVTEVEGDDNRFYLEPTTEASNLYFQAFLIDVQDDIIAQRAVLEHHIATGRTDQLCTAAENHRRTAFRLVAEAKVIARRAERSIRSVSPDKEAIPLLRRFEEAATEATLFDSSIALRISEQMEIAEDEAADHLARTDEHIRNARRAFQMARNTSTDLIGRLEKAAAAIACRLPRSLAIFPDIEADLAAPLMALPPGDAAVCSILPAFIGARTPAGLLLDPCAVAEAWLPKLPKPEADHDFAAEPELEPMTVLCPPRFGERRRIIDEAVAFITAHGAEAGSLSRLFRHPRAANQPAPFHEALALVVAAAFKDQGGADEDLMRLPGLILSKADGTLPADAPVLGDDMLILAAA